MRSPDYYIYFDEYKRRPSFALTAALVQSDKVSALLAEWDELRQRIKQQLVSNNYLAKDSPHLSANQLPEIHAVALFQSQGYYRKYEEPVLGDNYWLNHYAWLREALELIRKHSVTLVAFGVPDVSKAQESVHLVSIVRASLARLLPPKKLSRLIRVVQLPYLVVLPAMLMNLEQYLANEGKTGSVVCDDHELSKGFQVLNTVAWLGERNHYNHLTPPTFASGLNETLLQVADVACYVIGSHVHASYEGRALKEPLSSWWHEIVEPLIAGGINGLWYSDQAPKAVLIALEVALREAIPATSDLHEIALAELRKLADATLANS